MVLRRTFGPKRDEVTGEWRKLRMRSSVIVFLTKYYAGNQIENNEMGGACSTYGDEMCVQGFGGNT
jgi:hypothetical protein